MSHFYFEKEDSDVCYTLEELLIEAYDNGVDQIELFEAAIYSPKKYVWCSLSGICIDRCDCNRSSCDRYEKPTKGIICEHRGVACHHGKKVKFDVKTGKQIK